MTEATTDGKRLHYEKKSSGYFSSDERSRRIVELVGAPGRRVLDIGCGPGHIGALLKERGNYVVGCELSETAANEARSVLDDVLAFDIEVEWPAPLREQPFDVVVFGEVLEHVFDPVNVLLEARRSLTQNGRVVITTPNFLVWIARLQVLFGRFRYKEYGIFDFGHIRWFTYKYLKQVLHDSGFELEVEQHMLHPRLAEPAMNWWPSLFALHFVVSARRIEPVPLRTKLR